MTTTLFVILFQRMFRQRSILFKLIFEIFSVALTLVLIFYASESFSFKSTPELQDTIPMFIFLLIGEVALILPMSLAERWLGNLANLRNQQFYQTLLGLRLSPFRYIFSQLLTDLLFPFLRVFFVLVGGYFLTHFSLSLISMVYFLLLQLTSIVIFLCMAMIASLFYLKFNRGFSFFYTFQTLSTIIGGAYFPTSVFPNGLRNFSMYLPQTQILSASRRIFSALPIPMNTHVILITWLIILSFLVVLLRTYIVKDLKINARFF